MTPTPNDIRELYDSIASGKYDAWLDFIIDTCNTRRNRVRALEFVQLKSGDRVVIGDKVSPAAIQGSTAVIKSIDYRKMHAVIDLDEPVYTSRSKLWHKNITVKPSHISRVEGS